MKTRYQHKLCPCGQPATRRVFNVASCERCYARDQERRTWRPSSTARLAMPEHRVHLSTAEWGWL